MTLFRFSLIALALSLVAAAGGTVWWVQHSEDEAARQQVKLASHQAALRLQDYLRTRLTVVESLGHDMQLGLLGNEDLFMLRTRATRERFGGFKAINWIDTGGSIRWLSPLEGNEKARGKNVFEQPAAGPSLRKAFDAHELQITPFLKFFQGGVGFAAYYPVVRDGELLGCINGVFDAPAAIRDCLSAGALDSYEVRVHSGRRHIYETAGFREAKARDFATAELHLMHRVWHLELAPSTALYSSQHPGNAWFVLAGAVGFLAALFGLAIELNKRRIGDREKARLAALVKESSDVHMIVGDADEVLYLNAAGKDLLGVESSNKTIRFQDLVHRQDELGAGSLSNRLGQLDRWAGEAILQGPDNSQLLVLLRAVRLNETLDGKARFAVAASDLRDQRRLETELRQVQKLEALSHLAGGVAHDFNNLLTALLGYAQMAREADDVPATVIQDLDQIIKAGERGAALTQNLLVMSRRQVTVAKPISLSVQIEQSRELLRTLIPENIDLKLDLAQDLPAVLIDPVQLEQVLLNLVLNAAHAMASGGRLQIQTERQGDHGEWCVLIVEDNGCGMSPDVQRRATEPFFSTRAQGLGTGLGLFSAHGILNNAGGQLEIQSREQVGTRIEARFPASTEDPQSILSNKPSNEVQSTSAAQVLLVEDDPDVLEAARRTLEGAGHSVQTARDGQEALKIFERTPDLFEILVSDIVMPRLGGRELARILVAQRPSLRVLLCSGYVDKGLSTQELNQLNAVFLVKPYEPGQLLAELNQQLAHSQQLT